MNPSSESESATGYPAGNPAPATPPAESPAATPAALPVSENKAEATGTESKLDLPISTAAPSAKGSGSRAARRPNPTAARRAPGDTVPASKAPPQPDKAKTIAFAVCGLLLVGIVIVGGYLIFKPKPIPTVKAPLDRLNGDAKALAEKALRAEALYKEGTQKGGSASLADLREADSKLTEANLLFNDIVDQNQTVDGFKEQIELARNKKLNIDKELRVIRVKIDTMESQERVERLKNAPPAKPVENTTPAPVTPAVKEPTEAELSDANLEKLFKDDPSEYERLAKIRHEKDPNYVIKKE